MSGMLSAEEAVRARLLTLLRADAAVMAAAHRVYDRAMPRMTAPYIMLGIADGRDWGTKDREGREVMQAIQLIGGRGMGSQLAAAAAACAVTARGETDGWNIVSARIMRSRWMPQDDGGWQNQIMLRCRCLRTAAA